MNRVPIRDNICALVDLIGNFLAFTCRSYVELIKLYYTHAKNDNKCLQINGMQERNLITR